MKKQLYLKVYNKDFKVHMEISDHKDYISGDSCPGVHYMIELGGPYVASVIKKRGSYGYDNDKWEVALTYHMDVFDRFDLVQIEEKFDELLDNVIGYLTEEEVNDWLDKFYNEYVKKEESA